MKNHLRKIAVFICIGVTVAFGSALAEDRYPLRLPDWLWNDDLRYSILLDPEVKQDVLVGLKEAELLHLQHKDHEADQREREAIMLLHSNFATRDFARGADLIREPTSGRTIGVHFDPQLPSDILPVLKTAISVYLRFATTRSFINKAMAASVEIPAPMPSQTLKDSKSDTPNPDFVNYLQSVAKPRSVNQFIRELNDVLAPSDGSLPLLVISAYSGGPWWGGGIYNFYYSSHFRLSRFSPQGYLYIRLNTDKMKPGSYRWDSPNFWASKISHEILHNLGYWHPSYANPKERDDNNKGNTRDFLVAYESFLLDIADEQLP